MVVKLSKSESLLDQATLPGWCSTPGATAVMENGMCTLSNDSGYKAMCRNDGAGGAFRVQ